MEMSKVLEQLLPLGKDWEITGVVLQEDLKRITITVGFNSDFYRFEGNSYKLYDELPEREWQHLPWFQYRCYIKCKTPRYVSTEGQVKSIPVPWAESRKGYTNLFATHVIAMLQLVQVQNKVAVICQTTDYIIRSIMEDAVNKAACVERLVLRVLYKSLFT